MSQLGSNQEEKPDPVDKIKPLIAVVAVVAQPAKDESCNVPDMKSGSELGPASEINMKFDTDEETCWT